MNLTNFTLQPGQRFQYRDNLVKNSFIGEVINIRKAPWVALKIVQIQSWPYGGLGAEYIYEDLSRENYTYLPGQDKLVNYVH